MATTRTVRELLEGALRKVGVYELGETQDIEEMNNALQTFQDMLAAQGGTLLVPYEVQEAITLVVGQASYTIGENGTPSLNTQRPEKIIGAWIRDSSNYDYPVEIIGEKQYRGIVSKTTPGRPDKVWFSPTSPNGTIYTYPTPNSAEALWITSIKSLTEPTALTENLLNTYGIERKYHLPLQWLLVAELADEKGRPISPLMAAKIAKAERDLLSLNVARRVQPVSLEVPGCRSSDWSIWEG